MDISQGFFQAHFFHCHDEDDDNDDNDHDDHDDDNDHDDHNDHLRVVAARSRAEPP